MQGNNDSSELLGQIAGFTSLRDVDLLELSLLKSVFTIVNPTEVSLVTLDNHNRIQKKVDYASGKHGTVCEQIEATDDFLAACEQLDGSNIDYCTVTSTEGLLTVFMLSHNRILSHYVTVHSTTGVSKPESQQILGMLQIYRNFKLLLQESQTDELTGLSNRKTFDFTLRKIHDSAAPIYEEFKNEKRIENTHTTYWLAMIDIDHFKNINDSLGHLIGDEVLVRVSQALQASVRTDDMLFRYGGDEFAVILRSPDGSTTSHILERIRSAVENIVVPGIGDITISIGVVESKKEIFHLTAIENADKALYKSKDLGRNQITFHQPDGDDSCSNNNDSSVIDLF